MAAQPQIISQPDQLGSTPLSNPKWERFCQAVASGESLTEAAKLVGFAEGGANNAGSRLRRLNPEVDNRISFLSKSTGSSAGLIQYYGKEWALMQAVHIQRRARKADDHQTNLACLQFIARVQGFFEPNRTSQGRFSSVVDNRSVNLFSLSAKNLQGVVAEHLASIPVAERQALLEAAPEIAEAAAGVPRDTIRETVECSEAEPEQPCDSATTQAERLVP